MRGTPLLSRVSLLLLLVSLFSLLSPVQADTQAAIATNPETGRVEKVWPEWDGNDYEIHWAEHINGEWAHEAVLTDNDVDDVAPHLSHNAGGATAVVWKQGGTVSRIYYRARKQVSGTWTWQSAATPISGTTYNASAPWICFDSSGDPFVAYRETGSGSSTRVMSGGGDGTDPWDPGFAPVLVSTTSYTDNLHLSVRAETTHVWVDWVDSSTQLAYSEWDTTNGSWGTLASENYSGASDIQPGKERIRSAITE